MAERRKPANWAVGWFPIYPSNHFLLLFLHWAADGEGPDMLPVHRRATQKTIRSHIYAYCQLRVATSPILIMHVFELWEEAENPENPGGQGGEDLI